MSDTLGTTAHARQRPMHGDGHRQRPVYARRWEHLGRDVARVARLSRPWGQRKRPTDPPFPGVFNTPKPTHPSPM